jgi:hypothetical protein
MNGLFATSGWIWCASKLAELRGTYPADDNNEAVSAEDTHDGVDGKDVLDPL